MKKFLACFLCLVSLFWATGVFAEPNYKVNRFAFKKVLKQEEILSDNISQYRIYVIDQIQKNWSPPRSMKSYNLTILFTLSRDGSLLQLNVLKSSGNQIYDNAAMETIRKCVPFNPLPENFYQSTVNIEMTFKYRKN